MATVTRDFTRYVLYYLSGGSASVGVAQDAEIDCFDDSGGRAGAIYFHSSGRLPQNLDTVNGIYLYFKLARFADVMTILRQDKPLYLSLDTASKVGYIGTASEPVGESEPG